jgi:polar amino acid transport system substrate-binding protein
MKRLGIALVVLVAMAVTMAACGGDDDVSAGDLNLITPGTLTVCTDAPYRPMEFEENGEYTGFDMDLMKAIADDLGLKLAVNNTGFDPITSGLAMESDQCDIAAASITITDAREENIDFSDPYFTADQSLLVANSSGISDLAGFSGKNLGVQTGTTGELYAQENAPADTNIVSYENPGDIFTALAAGDIEGVLQDIVPNADYALSHDDVTIVETYPTNEQYGLAVKEQGAEDLLKTVNDELAKLKDNGTYQEIYDKWF